LLGLATFALPGMSQTIPIDQFFADAWEEYLLDNPETATTVDRHEYDDRWADWSPSGLAARRLHMENRLAQLAQYDLDDLSSDDALSARLMRYNYESDLATWRIQNYLIRVGQLAGFHNAVYEIVGMMPARNQSDYDNILARLRLTPQHVDQNLEL